MDLRQCQGSAVACWNGPTSKACGWTRPAPAALLCFGMYGEVLPIGRRALRLVIPWKYGFKSIRRSFAFILPIANHQQLEQIAPRE